MNEEGQGWRCVPSPKEGGSEQEWRASGMEAKAEERWG